MVRPLSFALFIILTLAGFAHAAAPSTGQEFLTQVDSDVVDGTISVEEALIIKFHHVFEKDLVPTNYRVTDFAPLKCITPLVLEYETLRDRLPRESVEQIDGYLAVEYSRAAYTSPSGHFLLSYETTGANAVLPEDTDPANGIPDYIEKVALYFDECWEVEVVANQFQAPDIGLGTYSVSFVAQESYGYTTIVNSMMGLTRIVMHPDYQGFPSNDDPEDAALGAAKVTAAHEFKHATQYSASGWSEGGWIEVDAVWAEELVFDVVNDYYNYLPGESPLRQPETPLDGGPTGTGSYEDCVWEIWLSETFGNEIITDFWQWREGHTTESFMDSWEALLGAEGITLAQGWANFSTWNYGTGYRALPGVGYEEAWEYPYGNIISEGMNYPFSFSGSVDHLAANVIRLSGFSGETNGTLDIQFNGVDAGADMTLGVHITRFNGTGAIETVNLDAYNDANYSCQIPLQDISRAAVVVGNAAKNGLSCSYDLTVIHTQALPQPGIQLDAESLNVDLWMGQIAAQYVGVGNFGEAGSTLNYDVQVWGNSPLDKSSGKSVAGSTLTPNLISYLPGGSLNVNIVVYNGSSDEEWLTDVVMDFPHGVTVTASTDFVGGTYGSLMSNNSSGNGALVSWHGTVGAENYGVIKGHESAVATISLAVDSSFRGPLNIAGTIVGDSYGANPHSLALTVTLDQADPVLAVVYPNGGEAFFVGSTEIITWQTMGGVDFVDVAISRNGGDSWQFLAENLPNTGSLDAVMGGPSGLQAMIRVSDSNSSATDTSDGQFSIIDPVAWLEVTPSSGSLYQNQTDNLRLDFVAENGSIGLNEAWLVINHDGADSPTVLPVGMHLEYGPVAVGTPRVFALNGVYPNPFNPMTRISFNLPAEARTSVDVLDLRGRVVRALFVGTMAEGEQQLNWDGRDNQGKTVAAGLYLARLRTVGYEATVKMTLAK